MSEQLIRRGHVLERRSSLGDRSSDGLAAADSKQVLAQRLIERETFHRAVLDGIELGIVTTEPSGTVTFINRTARTLLGVKWVSGGDVRELLGLHSAPHDFVSSTSKLAYTLPTQDGELDLELSIHRTEGFCGAADYFFVFRDVSEEKSRADELERFERLAAMGTMVAGFAHEVRNPVASLRSLAESLAEDLADANIQLPHVSRMLQVLERIERLVRTSLQFGRPAVPRRGHHRPWAIVAAALGEVGPRIKEGDGEIRLEVEPDLPDVFVDEGQSVQVLVILLNNALDSVGSAQRVLVRVLRAEDSKAEGAQSAVPLVRFEVHDDGLGIPAAILGRIFDPFFTTKPSGTGLGLSIAQQLVSENGGHFSVSSSRGAPTTFAVFLPTG
ncbi:MAG: PAS domain-containing protein [Myxococcales bacterium]|nr:PAS domain-containing protein [Myxococcales bacterium]